MSNDLQAAIESRIRRILDAHPDILDIPVRAKRIASGNARFVVKAAQLYRLADEMKEMLDPFVVCSSGCSHCCYLPTMIYQHEADAMAVAAKCRARKLNYRLAPFAMQASKKFIGQPCPFLVDGLCSIYEHRPLICRLHNSLNDDPEDCLVEAGATSKEVGAVDADYVEMPYMQAVLRWRPSEPWGAIQEFFPPGSVASPGKNNV